MSNKYKCLIALSVSVVITISAAVGTDASAQSLAKGKGAGSQSMLLQEDADNRAAGLSTVSEPAAHELVSVSATPTDHRIRIVISDPAFFGSSASITDPNGQLMQEVLLKHVTNVDVANWPTGSYTMRLVDGRTVRIDHH